MNILIVDEDVVSSKKLKVMLEKKGYAVLIATSGREAIKFINEGFKIDLVMSDVKVPDVSGMSLLRFIRNDNKLKNIPFIFSTMINDEETVVEAMNHGISEYIIKPLDEDKIEAKIQNVIDTMPGAILVVDDEKILRDLVTTALMREDYNVLTAENGKEALDVIKKDKIALVISDVKMPVMSGLELLVLIKERHRDIPVIMMTGFSLDFTKEQALSSGADDYITKPFKNVEIITKVRSYYGKKKKMVSS
ncbi:MAG: response regulator [Calditrichaeota bacterium]|nr:MAG: response regulator [Calditrichota bacterium]